MGESPILNKFPPTSNTKKKVPNEGEPKTKTKANRTQKSSKRRFVAEATVFEYDSVMSRRYILE
jgi:hypothetical protein